MPIGWALDANGYPTTDPSAGLMVLSNSSVGIGYGLSLMVDILSGLLSGGHFLDEVSDMWTETKPQGVSHFFIVIDPIRLLGAGNYYDRMDTFIETIKSSTPSKEHGEILLPGEIEYQNIQKHRKNGIPITRELLTKIKQLAFV